MRVICLKEGAGEGFTSTRKMAGQQGIDCETDKVYVAVSVSSQPNPSLTLTTD